MPDEESIIYEDRQYLENRLNELRAFFENSPVKGLRSKMIEDLFTFLLASQDPNGSWPDVEGDGRWTCVQTAVILKALARLGYTRNSTWPIVQGGRRERGGIEKALSFFKNEKVEIHPERNKDKRIEDIWDTCQVLLAFASYGRQDEYQDVFFCLEANWEQLYEKYLDSNENSWSGPAFLAAMLDVFVLCNSDDRIKQEALDYLKKIGKNGGEDYSGFLRASGIAEPCWHGALVLRTLAGLPESLLSRKEKEVIFEGFVPKLLAERGTDPQGNAHPFWGKEGDLRKSRSMHTARALEGLACALPYLDEDLADDVKEAINRGNNYFDPKANKEPGFPGKKIDTLKSTTAVAEYFASLTSDVPAGALIDAAECLSKQIDINFRRSSRAIGYDDYREVNGGLRIFWFSDLHIGEVKKSKKLFALKRNKFFRSLFLERKNIWTENFASENLKYIMKRVEAQKPNHVLITGDVANLAMEEQYEEARKMFLRTQTNVGVEGNGLSPDYWTILPGNHDVSEIGPSNKLYEFFKCFKETYPNGHSGKEFPIRKKLRSSSSGFELELIGLDSTPNSPVQVIGMNARGQLSEEQKNGLRELLTDSSNGKFAVVALHHAPLSVPFLKSGLGEYFMSLEDDDARDLIDLCCDYGAKGILHGHYHTYSPWLVPVVRSKQKVMQMPIVGAPCGTTGAPGQNVEFLELREVDVFKGASKTPGLSVIRHKMEEPEPGSREPKWDEKDLGVVIY